MDLTFLNLTSDELMYCTINFSIKNEVDSKQRLMLGGLICSLIINSASNRICI